MLYISIYCILLLALFLYSAAKQRLLGTILAFLYLVSGIMGLWGMTQDFFPFIQITLFPLLFLIAGYLLFFFPFLSKNMPEYDKITHSIDHKVCFNASIAYSMISLVAILFFLPPARDAFLSANWNETRRMLYSGDLQLSSSNPIVHICVLISSYLYFAALFLGYFMLYKKEKKTGLLFILFSQAVMLLSDIITSSRGMIIYQLLYNIVLYLYFFRSQKKIYRLMIMVVGGMILIPIFNILMDITNDRFGENNAIDSIIEYLGQPSIVFNYGVYPIHSHMWGKYALGDFLGKKTYFDQNMIGGKWETYFYTFMGFLYIDWGLIGTILLGLLVVFFFSTYLRKRSFRISEIYLLFEYFRFLIDGVLVIGRGIIYRLISIVFAYCIIRTLETMYPQIDCISPPPEK